nr:TRAP transporter small permease [Desulfobacula sp.]
MLGKISKKLDTVLTNIEEWTLFGIVMAALISLFANVVLRYGFNYTLAWSEELGRIVMIYTTFVGTSLSIKKGAMIRIDALVQIFPKLKPGLSVYSNLLILFFAWMMVYYGYKMTLMQYTTHQSTIIMQIPLVIVYAIMPVMGIMVFIRTIQVLIQDIKRK